MTNHVPWIALAAVLSLAACSKPAPPAAAANTAAAPFTPSYGSAPAPTASAPPDAAAQALGASATPDQTAAFNASFDKATHDSCVGSAQNSGASADAAEKYCSCVVAKLEPLSVQEKM